MTRALFPTWTGIFSLRHSVQTGSGTHTASYIKWPGHEADHSDPFSAKVKISWSCTFTFSIHLHGVMLSSQQDISSWRST